MPSIFNLGFSILCLGVISSPASWAGAGDWEPLTSTARPDCREDKPCRLSSPTAAFEIRVEVEEKAGLQILRQVEIRDVKSGSRQTFKLTEVNGIDLSDHFQILKTKLGPRRTLDFAVYAYNSAREGKTFYYFLYNPVTGKFVVSEGTYPELNYDPKTQNLVSDLQKVKYKISPDLHLTPQ